MKSVLLSSALILLAGAVGRSDTAPPPASLSDFFKPGVAFLDTNDDGAVDFVDARIVLPERPSPAEDKIAADVKQYLDVHNMTTSVATVPAVMVQSKVEGVDRVVVDAQMASAGDVVKAQVALNQLKAVGGRDPKRALSYPAVRNLRARIHAGGAYATVDLPRAAPPDPSAQPPGRRPGGAAKETFDLSSFYANEGAPGAPDTNLIPDRIDPVLSADGDAGDG